MPTPTPVTLDPNRSTHDHLADRGLTHRKPLTPTRKLGAREVLNAEGAVVFVGDCFAVNGWMRSGMSTQAVA